MSKIVYGYCGVIIPTHDFFDVIEITNKQEVRANELIRQIGEQDSKVHRVTFPGMRPEKNAALKDNLISYMVELRTSGSEDMFSYKAAALALYMATKKRYFIIHAMGLGERFIFNYERIKAANHAAGLDGITRVIKGEMGLPEDDDTPPATLVVKRPRAA